MSRPSEGGTPGSDVHSSQQPGWYSSRDLFGALGAEPHARVRLESMTVWFSVRVSREGSPDAFVPYAAMKLAWASGGTFAGITGEEMLAGRSALGEGA
ncbi:hypothetical protein [Streptomyces goshikiensis]|uniref:hypothetical protein n=1 Tax=Streptomyces goshikiensis TaxID=1942 RepID=UPI003675F8CE